MNNPFFENAEARSAKRFISHTNDVDKNATTSFFIENTVELREGIRNESIRKRRKKPVDNSNVDQTQITVLLNNIPLLKSEDPSVVSSALTCIRTQICSGSNSIIQKAIQGDIISLIVTILNNDFSPIIHVCIFFYLIKTHIFYISFNYLLIFVII